MCTVRDVVKYQNVKSVLVDIFKISKKGKYATLTLLLYVELFLKNRTERKETTSKLNLIHSYVALFVGVSTYCALILLI